LHDNLVSRLNGSVSIWNIIVIFFVSGKQRCCHGVPKQSHYEDYNALHLHIKD